jgi:hypothetical protein
MTVHNIQITATDNTKTAFANIERSLGALNATAGKVTSTFAALIGGLSVGKIIEVSKNFQNLEVALKSVSAAGTDTKALLKTLADASNGTSSSVGDMVEAYRQLKLAGVDASVATIKSLKNLSAAGGIELGRTAELIGKAFRGEFGKLDDFGVEVENRYGQFVIKYQGQTQAIVGNTRQVVEEIIKLSNTNASFADAAAARAKTLDAQLSKLKGTVEKGIGASNLADSLATLVSRVNEFFVSSGSITKAANYLASAINFIGDNFSSLVIILGGVVAYFKVFQPLISGISKGVNVFGQALRTAGGIASTLLAPLKYLYDAVYYFGVNMLRAIGVLDSAFPILASITFAFRGLLVNLLRLAGWVGVAYAVVEATNLVIKTFTGFDIIDWVVKKYDTLIAKAKEWMGIANDMPKTTAADFQRTDKDTSPVATPASALKLPGDGKLANTFLQDLIGNFGKARSELKMLMSAMNNTKDINLLSLMFEEASNRAEKFGQILEKPANLIQRDYSLAVSKTTEELRRLEIELANDAVTTQRFNNELKQSSLELYAQSIRLSDSALMSRKFQQEIQQTNLGLIENAMKLKNAGYQQDVFNLSVIKNRQDVEQQKITLDLLNKGYEAGTLTLREYTDALKGIDDRMLGVDQLKAMAQATREQTRAEFERSKALRDSYTLYEEIQMVAEDSTKKAGDALTQNLTDAIRTGKGLLSSFKDFFNQILTDIANAIIKKQFVNPIVDSLSGLMSGKGGAGGGIASSIGNIFSGSTSVSGGLGDIWGKVTNWFSGLGFAEGGRPPVGQASIVGEAGPELFVPDSAGTIVPNGAMNQPIVVNLNLSAIDTQSGVEFLVQNRAVITGVVQQAFNRNAKNGFA